MDPKSLNAYLSGRKLAPVVGTRDAEFYKQKVRAGMKVADELKVQGTPTLLVLTPDGKLTEVHGAEAVRKLIEST